MILSDARARAYRAINTAMVTAYWEIERAIVEQEQQRHEIQQPSNLIKAPYVLEFTRAKPLCVTLCPNTISRFSPPATSSTCPRKRNWQPSYSANDKPSKWRNVCEKRRTNERQWIFAATQVSIRKLKEAKHKYACYYDIKQ